MKRINIFTYGYWNWKYPSFWPHNCLQFFKNFKYAWQRATKGYCDIDLWELDYFYTYLFADSLHEFAERSHGAPDTFCGQDTGVGQTWKDYINETADCFEKSLENTWECFPAVDEDFKRGWARLGEIFHNLWD